MAKVYLKFDGAVIKEIELKKENTTFGRKPNNEIVIDNPSISGFHGRIVKEGDVFSVEDLNSTNGTFLNGQRVKHAMLKHRDQIGIARHVLEFSSDIPAPAATSIPVTLAPVAPKAPEKAPTPVKPPEPVKATDSIKPVEPVKSITPAKVELTPEQKGQLEMLKKNMLMPDPPQANTPKAASPVDEEEDQEEAEVEAFPIMKEPAAPPSIPAVIKVIAGGVNGQTEVRLKDLVTYIGTADQAAIKIKGLLAPSLAAAVSRRPEGYFLKAVKSGYPKVNGKSINDQVLLENGSLIEAGGTNLVFYLPDHKKQSE